MDNEVEQLSFHIVGTDLTYTVPSEVINPPVFSIVDGQLIVMSRGFFPEEAVFSIAKDGQFAIDYDFSAYTKQEIDAFYKIRELLRLSPNDLLLDSYILYYLKGVERFILNYCALRELPVELWYVLVEMATAKTEANKNGFASFSNATPTTVKDGSQSVTYSSAPSASLAGISKVEQEEFLNGWGHQLRQFRRMKWG